MKNKSKLRRIAKVMAVAKAMVDFSVLQAGLRQELIGGSASYSKLIALSSKISRITRTSYKAFGINGKIDKRGYKRYVTGHKKAINPIRVIVNCTDEITPVLNSSDMVLDIISRFNKFQKRIGNSVTVY